MESLSTIKLPAETRATGKSEPGTGSASAGDSSQAADKKSFSSALSDVKQSGAENTDTSTEPAKESDVADAGKQAVAVPANTTKNSKPEPDLKLPLFDNGQELPPLDFESSQNLPPAASEPVTAVPTESIPTAGPVVTQVVTQVLATQSKQDLSSNELRNPGKVKNTVPAAVLLSADTRPADTTVKAVDLQARDEQAGNTFNLLKQLQNPLLQKTVPSGDADLGKLVEKGLQLVAGSDLTRSETLSAARTPESGQNISLVSDPTKTASENILRVAQAPKISLPVTDAGWGEEFSSRVSWMTKNNISSAQIKLNPAHLGPIEVRLSLQNDQAAVSFISNHALVRDAIDSASARLRESFAEGGFSNLDVDVSSREDMNRRGQDQDEAPVYAGAAMGNQANDESEPMLQNQNATMNDELISGSHLRVDFFA